MKYWILSFFVLLFLGLSAPISAQKSTGDNASEEHPIRSVSKARGMKIAPSNRQVSKLPESTPEEKPAPTSGATLMRAHVKPMIIKPRPEIPVEEKIKRLEKEIAALERSSDPMRDAKIEKLEKVLEKRRQEKIFEDNRKRIESKPKPKTKPKNIK